MEPRIFIASVKYGDWEGTASADNADENGPSTWLQQNNHIGREERLVGLKIYYGENDGNYDNTVDVEFLFVPSTLDAIELSKSPVVTRKLRLQMPLKAFFGLFKRFEIAVSLGGILASRNVVCAE